MHSPKNNAGSSGVCSRLRIELLEMRCLMDAAGLASQIAPLWFQNVAGQSAAQHAGTATWTAEDTIAATQQNAASSTVGTNVYDWIVQFDTASLGGISSVAQTISLLAGGGIEFEALRGLGLAGMVLVRSSGASLGTVETGWPRDTDVASFEEDAYRAADATLAAASSATSATSSQWDLAAINAQSAWTITTRQFQASWWPSSTRAWTTTTSIWPPTFGRTRMSATTASSATCTATISSADNGNPMDDNGHGTHVAGTIAAEAQRLRRDRAWPGPPRSCP